MLEGLIGDVATLAPLAAVVLAFVRRHRSKMAICAFGLLAFGWNIFSAYLAIEYSLAFGGTMMLIGLPFSLAALIWSLTGNVEPKT